MGENDETPICRCRRYLVRCRYLGIGLEVGRNVGDRSLEEMLRDYIVKLEEISRYYLILPLAPKIVSILLNSIVQDQGL